MAHRDSHLTAATSITDAMATEETAEGIRKFASDVVRLERFIASKLKTGNLARVNSSAYRDGARAHVVVLEVVLERAHESNGVPEARLGV